MPAGSEEIALQSLSPEEGFHKAFMGYVFQVQAWTGVTSGKVVDAETNLQKQMCGGEVVGAAGWTLHSHHGWGLSFLHFIGTFSPTVYGIVSQASLKLK